jgi:hypothetical protein
MPAQRPEKRVDPALRANRCLVLGVVAGDAAQQLATHILHLHARWVPAHRSQDCVNAALLRDQDLVGGIFRCDDSQRPVTSRVHLHALWMPTQIFEKSVDPRLRDHSAQLGGAPALGGGRYQGPALGPSGLMDEEEEHDYCRQGHEAPFYQSPKSPLTPPRERLRLRIGGVRMHVKRDLLIW